LNCYLIIVLTPFVLCTQHRPTGVQCHTLSSYFIQPPYKVCYQTWGIKVWGQDMAQVNLRLVMGNSRLPCTEECQSKCCSVISIPSIAFVSSTVRFLHACYHQQRYGRIVSNVKIIPYKEARRIMGKCNQIILKKSSPCYHQARRSGVHSTV
jgi:hypothetical protein